MYWAVVEETALAEVQRGVTELFAGREAVHGSWEPAARSARLLHWLDPGLIEFCDNREGPPTNRPDPPDHPGTRHGWGYAIGAPAVVFTDWPPLRDGFLTELCARLGGRTHVVRARI